MLSRYFESHYSANLSELHPNIADPQVWVVCASDPQLPLQIEDAGRRVTDDEEGNFAKVNQDTRLDNRVLDLRTPTNQAIFRLEILRCLPALLYLVDLRYCCC